MKRTIFALLILTMVSCGKKEKNEFSLVGRTNGIVNGTVLYMEDILTKETIYSARVRSDSFRFGTKLPRTPVQVVLRTKDYSHYRNLWLENKAMTFGQSRSDFRKATVEGSLTR
ncbi:DUF4369 domain-containing protein [Flagellimonas hadalis]|uniref:DUF4369 domain-containing protein n=1 Tax=Flagellimonas hadalis TaxID=2597517 RepID=A0A5N5ITB2_9FLAO|nr:DUF4369 domain-containing protein [Allomuricauda hadalis]KAB5484488.1 DUF4369 domain-containing protein [Allomuricauda hadalis]